MKTFFLVTCAAIAAATQAPAASGDPPYPLGERVQLDRDGFANPLALYLPENYSADQKWPVVFHYPGTGGRPDVDLPLAFTGGRDFVLVGMDYATRNLESSGGDYLPVEMAALRSVRDDLAAELQLDTSRVYVGGFSKGGWFASEFAEVYMREFAGAYILGAGKSHRRVRNPVAFGPVKKPVYIGPGQFDPNYIYAVRAVEHFRTLGGAVTFDEYLGLGHAIETGSTAPSGFANWWAIEAARGAGDSSDVSAKLARWHAGLEGRLGELDSPLERSLLLERARRNPFYALLNPAQRSGFEEAAKTLAADPGVAIDNGLRSSYFRLLDDESREESWSNYRSMAKRYHAFYSAQPGTYFGRRAALDCYRLGSLLGMDGRWRFPTEKEQRAAAEEATREPTPVVQVEAVLPFFRDLGNALAPF